MAIDDKVVSISFEHSKFESGVNATIAALEKLKKAMEFPHAGKGLDDISRAAGRMNLGHIGQGVDAIRGKLSALSVAGLAIFANLAVAAVSAGARIVKAFTLDPIIQGFQEYSTNLNAIQTILANTQASGAGLKDVNAALQDLNRYSDKTIYNFSQMAKNIGTFTAAGVDLKTATASIKGIANLAALSGSNADQASTAMYQLSQAIAAGSVKLQDWNSVVNAGMGGTVFQRALAQTAVKMGTLSDGAVKLSGKMKNVTINGEAFRQSLSTPGKASWLTSKVLTKTLQQFTGDLSDAQLAAEGFNKQEIKAIQATAKTAQEAATKVKTIAQVFDVAKETMGSGWAQTFQIIFGDFGEARTTFTALSNAINGFINTNAKARNKVLADWKALGGRTVLINGIKTAFKNLGEIIKPIKDAFHDIFPPSTGRSLFKMTEGFARLAAAIKPSKDTVDNLRRSFRGVFAIFDIAGQVIKGVVTMFEHMFKAVGAGKGNFLDFAGSIGDFIVKIDKALKKGDALGKFFGGIGDILAAPIRLIQGFASALGQMFSKFSPGEFSGKLKTMGKAFQPLGRLIDAFSQAWGRMMQGIGKININSVLSGIINAFTSIGHALSSAVSNINWDNVFTAVQTGLFASLVLMFKRFFGKGSFQDALGKALGGSGKGFLDNFKSMSKSISASFDTLRGSLQTMQNNLRAKTLKEIAVAVGILAGALLAISTIDPKKLNTAMSAITVSMGELLGAMGILSSISKSLGFVKLPFVATSLLSLAGAVTVLAAAMVIFASLSWDQLAKGVAGVAAGLAVLVAAAIPLSGASGGLIRAGLGLTAIAIAMDLLAFGVAKLGGMNLATLGKGIGAIGAGLAILVAAMRAMPSKGMVAAGTGLVILSVGLRIIANVVGKFAGMNWKQIGKGLAALAGALLAIVGAMNGMPKGMILQAAGLLAVSFALEMISGVLTKLGGMSWKEIGKGLAGIGGSLAILALGMEAMQGSIGGAVALTIAAAGLTLMARVLSKFGDMSVGKMIKSLVMLAATFAIIGAAGALLTPVIPSLVALGAALILIGTGLTLVGSGLFLIGAGLSALILSIATALGLLVTAIKDAVTHLPEFLTSLFGGLLQIGETIVHMLPTIITAFASMVVGLVQVLGKILPVIASAAVQIITTIATTIWNAKGTILEAGVGIVWAIIKGIVSTFGSLVGTVLSMIAKLIGTVLSQIGRIVLTGANLMLGFVRGVASRIGALIAAGLQGVTRFISAIAGTIGRWVSTGANLLMGFVRGILSRIGSLVSAGVQAIARFISSLLSAGGRLPGTGSNLMGRFIQGVISRSAQLVGVGAAAVGHFISGVLSAIGAAASAAGAAAVSIGRAIGEGMVSGVQSMAGAVRSAVVGMAHSAVQGVLGHLGINSPSRVFMGIGQGVVEGFAMGLDDHKQSTDAAVGMSQNLINAVKDVLQIASPSKVFIDLGKAVTQGFAQGLRGNSDDIKNAFAYMDAKIKEAMQSARKTIAEETAKLKQLQGAANPDAKAIAEAQSIIAQNEQLLKRSIAAHILLTKSLQDEKKKLMGLSDDYLKIADKLKAAKQALLDAQQTRADAIKNFSDQYGTLPDIVTKDAEGHSIDQLAAYEAALKHQADAVAAYQATLDQLRALGLDDATYQKLLQDGTADQQFADQLLAGGKTAVDGLNALDKDLKTNADALGKDAAASLYDAGVKAAQGLIKSLNNQESKIYKAMQRLARAMVKALKDELGIKSPSQVFFEIGAYSMEGLANGFKESKGLLGDAVDEAGNHALSILQKKMRDISDVVAAEIDPNPTITPILDLTQIRNASGELAALTQVTPITAATSFGQASAISAEQRAAMAEDPNVSVGGTHLTFEQNNYSPQSLSEIEIYRQTKNQLSLAKSALSVK